MMELEVDRVLFKEHYLINIKFVTWAADIVHYGFHALSNPFFARIPYSLSLSAFTHPFGFYSPWTHYSTFELSLKNPQNFQASFMYSSIHHLVSLFSIKIMLLFIYEWYLLIVLNLQIDCPSVTVCFWKFVRFPLNSN